MICADSETPFYGIIWPCGPLETFRVLIIICLLCYVSFFHLYACWSRQSSQGMSLHVCSTWSGLLFCVCHKLQWNVIGIERFSFRCRKSLRYVCGPVMSSVTCVWLLSVKVLQYQCIVVGLSVVSCFEQEIRFYIILCYIT